MAKKKLNLFIWIAVIAVSVIVDQISKLLVLRYLPGQGDSITVIPHVLDFTHIDNPGAAFGTLANARWVFMIASTVAIVAIIFYLIKFAPSDTLTLVSLALIAGGGIGNMIDRVFRGVVVDFIEATFIDFYIFNIADSCVCVGCGLMILAMILQEIKLRRDAKSENENEAK